MAEYQKVVIDQFKEQNKVRRIQPRTAPDLPLAIRGKGAEWRGLSRSATGKAIPASYALYDETGRPNPIEFINDRWYYIDWDDDDRYKGFWVYPEREIPQGSDQLGWSGNVLDTPTPTAPVQGGSQFRGRAESASTQPEEPQEEQAQEEDDPVDTNPIVTEALAATFEDVRTFEDIAEAVDPPQDRTHYLPTIIPNNPIIRPVGINPPPLRIRSGRGETIASTGVMDPVTQALRGDGALKGKVPPPFNGDRTKTQKFLNAFSLFWMNNEDNSHMKNPYKRCTYFLGLFDGEKVDDWVQDQTEQLRDVTTRRSDRVDKGDERLWQELTDAFEGAFAHTGRVEQARMELAKLEMEGNLIDEYIAKFENLLRKADIPRTEVGSIQKFKDGLKKTVLSSIMRRDQWPETINEWEEHARREVRRTEVIKEAMGEGRNFFITPKQARWRTAAHSLRNSTRRRDGVVPMEVDATRTYPLDPKRTAELDKLRREGRCFKCLGTGHIKRECPKWSDDQKPKPTYAPTRNRSTRTEQEPNPEEIVRSMKALQGKDQDKLFSLLMEGGEDF